MKEMLILGLLYVTGAFSSTCNLGLFCLFSTTLAPDGNDPTKCRGNPREWTLCSGSRSPTRSTTDSCPKLTEKCSTGKLIASHFIASALSSEPPLDINELLLHSQAYLPCRSVTNEHVYTENVIEANSFKNTHFRVKRSTTEQFWGSSSSTPILSGCSRKKRQIYGKTRDIAILMDESGSVGRNNFEKMKRIASGFVRLLCGKQALGISNTRIALTSFDSKVHHHKDLIDGKNDRLNTDGTYLSGFIDQIVKYDSTTEGSTCLVEALDFVRSNVLGSNGARRGQSGVVQEIVLLTDGCNNCAGKPVSVVARSLRSTNIDVYVIGIGLGSICQRELDKLAEGGKCFHFFNIFNWKTDLNEFIEQIEHPPKDFCLPQLYANGATCAQPSGR